MPQVPYTGVPDVSAENIPAPPIRVNPPPAAFGTTVAQAVEHLGTTVGQVGNELFNRAVAMQELRNETEVTNATAAHERDANDSFAQFEKLQGNNAASEEAWNTYRKQQDDLRVKHRDSLSNDMAKKMFDRSSLSTMNRALFAGAKHAGGENRKAFADSKNNAIDSAVDTAKYATDPEEFNKALVNIDNLSRDVSVEAGHDEGSANQYSFKNQSRAWANRIVETARRDPGKANQMFQEAIEGKKLHSTDYDRVEKVVHSELNQTGARSVAQDTFRAIKDPEGWLQQRVASPKLKIEGLHPEFASRLQAAGDAAKRATGEDIQIESLVRSTADQARIYAENAAKPGGIRLHPAALPGSSRHEFGEAADLKDGKALKWLHDHAGEFGLEFLKGRTGINDPGHIQLARGESPTRTYPTYEISETQLADMARHRAEQIAPGNVDFADSAVNRTIGQYRQQREMDRQAEFSNTQKINEGLLNAPGPVYTIDELRKLSPEVNNAYDALSPTSQKKLEKSLLNQRTVSDITEKRRLEGMAAHKDQFADFLKEDIDSNPKLSRQDKDILFKRQRQIEAKAEENPHVAFAMGPNGIGPLIDSYTRKDTDKMNILRGFMFDEIQRYQQIYKKPPSAAELKEIGQRVLYSANDYSKTVTGSYTGFQPPISIFGLPNILKKFERGDQPLINQSVPDEDADRIRVDPRWAAKNLPPPNESQIKTIWMIEQYDKLYGKSGRD